MGYLAQVTFGPVQGFIATARRSRDLWFGSLVLSQISKAAAGSLRGNSKVTLVFPFADDLKDKLGKSDFLVTNIVTCSIATDNRVEVENTLIAARDAAQNQWEALCTEAKAIANPESEVFDASLWDAQLQDVVEVYYGAVPFNGDYSKASDDLRTLMANRKNSRLFKAYRDHERRPKSSLDGAQSTVLTDAFATAASGKIARRRKRLGIERNEQLDTAALVKRLLGQRKSFLPSARVAAQEWVARIAAADGGSDKLKELEGHLAKLAKLDIGTQFGGGYDQYEWVKPLPFDGQLLYRNRLAVELDSIRSSGTAKGADVMFDPDDIEQAESSLAGLDDALKALQKKFGAPQPYYGLLLADGDKMGKLLDHAATRPDGLEQHRNISKSLSEFAQGVPKKMRDKEGACIYSGGDDVLGLVPVHRAVEIAQELRDFFSKSLAAVAAALGVAESERPTLSVGIALVHFLEPLGDARELAQRAEKLAKGGKLAETLQRNALCLLAKPRGGAELAVRIRWPDSVALKRLTQWQSWMRPPAGTVASLPGGLAHELEQALANCRRISAGDDEAEFKKLWGRQVRTVLSKKRPDETEISDDVVEDIQTAMEHDPEQSVALLLMARWLAGRASSAGDEGGLS